MSDLPEIYGFGEESIKDAVSGFGHKIKSFINSKTSGLAVYKKTDKITFKVMSEINKKLRDLPSQYHDDFKIKHNALSKLGCDAINNMGKNGFPLRVAEAVKRGYNYKDKRFYYDQLHSRVEERHGNTLIPDRLEINGTPIWKLPNDRYTYPEYMDYTTVVMTTSSFSKKSGSDAQLRAFANVDSARNLLKKELSRDIYDDKTRKIMEKYYNDINDWINDYAKQCAIVTMFARSLSKQVDVEIRRLTGGDVKVATESFEYDLNQILNGNFDGLEEEYIDYFNSFTSEENFKLEGGLEDIMFYDEELINTNPDITEFTNGTEGVVTAVATRVADVFKDIFMNVARSGKHIKYTVTGGKVLEPADVEFMTKGVADIRTKLYDIYKERLEAENLTNLIQPIKLDNKDVKSAYNIFKSYTQSPVPEKVYRIPIVALRISNETTDYPRLKVVLEGFKLKFVKASRDQDYVLRSVPSGFGYEAITERQNDGSYVNMLYLYNYKFKSSNTVVAGNESYSLKYIENVLSDEFIFQTHTPMSIFGLESGNPYGFIEKQELEDLIKAEGGIENFIPVDMDYASYIECIGTEGITNFLARGWAKFRRVMHPIIKSDLKVTQTKYEQIKSTFEQTVNRMVGPLKNELSKNRFLKFLMDNGALEINERAKNAFGNDSRMVAAVIVTFKSSKIRYEDHSGMITVNGKKIDIMDLRDDEKFLKPSESTGVIYGAINDAIKAINKTVYKQIKSEHILDQMGFAVKFLNDGTQHIVKKDGTMIYSSGDSIGSANTYTVENKNEITTQLNNKDILIGLVSRPLVVTGGTEALFDLDFDEMFEGGSEMDNTTTQTIIERMKTVNDTKEMIMKTPEYQRFAAGTEARDSINKAASSVEVKELLGKVYDNYGMEGLKNILK